MSDLISSIDSFSHQGYSEFNKRNHYNEDRLVIGRSIFAVIDGATALVPLEKDGLNASAYTSKFLSHYLYNQDETDFSAQTLLLNANKAFREYLEKEWPEVLDVGKLGPCAAVSLIKIHNKKKATISNISDCGIVTLNKDTEFEQISQHYARHAELDEELANAIFEELDKGLPIAEVKKLPQIVKRLTNNRSLINVEYGKFSAEEVMKDFTFEKEIDLTNIKTICLFSDGLFWPEEKDEKSAMLRATRFINELGVSAYYKKLKALKDSDPNFKKFKRLKHMDDATGMLITVND